LTSFNEFGLAEPILRALAHENYTTPTPIQNDAIPLVLAGRDLIGIAQTGTGKTAAFALPILNRLAAEPRPLDRKACRVLVLSPTRELSGQILDSFRTYGRHLKLSATLAIGGVPMGKQVRALLGGVDVLVATPGRLLDLVRGNALKLDKVDVLVLDEADRMLDMGFIHDIRKIITRLPKDRQTLLFSATMPREIAELAGEMLRDPARVAVTPAATTVERIAQKVIHTEKAAKGNLLVEVLTTEKVERAIVFTRTKHGADKVVRGLEKAGIASGALHGNKSQNQRERVLADFRAGRVRTLIATDIAARGIDVDGISHVINYDLPNVPESYVHRIGRTARAGAEGVAISFCDHEEAAYLRDIEKLIRIAIPAEGSPPPRQQRGGPHPAPRQQHRNGQRPNSQRFANGQPRPQRAETAARPEHSETHEPRRAEQDGPRRRQRKRGGQNGAQPQGSGHSHSHAHAGRNGNGANAGNKGGARPPQYGQPAPRPAGADVSGGEIGSVAFLQRRGERPQRNTRAQPR
jgi:ATP-dependent RNA helicase RhlE